MNVYDVAAMWVGMALIASAVSIWTAIPVALIEIGVGALAGNIPGIAPHLSQPEFVTFLAGVGSLVLTFLAGAEIDPVSLRGHWKASVSIGFVSFLLPGAAAFAFCWLMLGWTLHAAEIGGVALSTTSVAVVYAVMVETGLNRQDLGKLILAACFVTDLGTVLALGGLFASYGWLLLIFVAVSAAVLPAYLAGLVVAGVFSRDRVLTDRLRSIAFALLTPFFFLRAGTLISASALAAGAGIIGVLLLVKLAAKFAGVWPTAAAFGVRGRERTYTTLLMATGLTFGSIAALFGLTHHLIGRAQYTELVTVVVLSAFVPTIIAQQIFRPRVRAAEVAPAAEALGEEDMSVIRRRPG